MFCSAAPIQCTHPANTEGYVIDPDSNGGDLHLDSFWMDVACADGYLGEVLHGPHAWPCATQAGEYELRGCQKGEAFAHQSRLLTPSPCSSSPPSSGPLSTPTAHACKRVCSKPLRQSIVRTTTLTLTACPRIALQSKYRAPSQPTPMAIPFRIHT